MYTSSEEFLSGAAAQVKYTYRKLGGDVLDIELSASNVYANYEEAVLEYSYLINTHQGKNILSTVLGNTTGSFDHKGEIQAGDLSSSLGGRGVELKYPEIRFEYARRVGNAFAFDAGLGGTIREYSASFDIQEDVQDYNLQAIVSSSAAAGGVDYASIDRTKRIIVNRVFYRTPRSMWRFYGYYGGLNVVGNLATYGQYADDSTFELVPVWQNKLQAMNFEDMIYTRTSHYSYELRDNRLRIFPQPVTGEIKKMWFTFQIIDDAWTVDESMKDGIDGINPPYKIITSNKKSINKVIIIYPGASPTAEEHPKVLMLGKLLASIGNKIYIPRIPPLKNLDISEINFEWFALFYKWIIDYMERQEFKLLIEHSLIRTLEMGDFYARIEDRYGSLSCLLEGEIIKREPHEWGLLVLFHNYLKNLDLSWDSTGLQNAIQLKIKDNQKECSDQINKLPKDQRRIFNSIKNGKPNSEVK